jgi:hypothetical protein
MAMNDITQDEISAGLLTAVRWMAAAPAMLAELKWIAGRIDRNSGLPNFTSEEHDRILAVIAKAEGND